MNNGLKNLQSAARSASRRERLETSGHPMHGYDDDSGISGIGLTPVDDQLDASYSSPASSGSHHSSGASSGAHSVGGYGSAYPMAMNEGHHHQTAYSAAAAAAAQGYTTTGSTGALSSSFSSSHSSNAAYHPHSHAHHHQQHHQHHHHHHQHPDDTAAAYMTTNGQRLSSVDMGIESIINRPTHNGGPSI